MYKSFVFIQDNPNIILYDMKIFLFLIDYETFNQKCCCCCSEFETHPTTLLLQKLSLTKNKGGGQGICCVILTHLKGRIVYKEQRSTWDSFHLRFYQRADMSLASKRDCRCVSSDEIVVCDASDTDTASEVECLEVQQEGAANYITISSEEEPPKKKIKIESGECEVEVLHVDDKPVEREVQIIRFERGNIRNTNPDVQIMQVIPASQDEKVVSDSDSDVRVVDLEDRNKLSKNKNGNFTLYLIKSSIFWMFRNRLLQNEIMFLQCIIVFFRK